MSELLEVVLQSHGGKDRWDSFQTISAHQSVGGAIWGLKQSEGIVNDAFVTARLHEPWASISPFTGADRRSIFTPERVAIEEADGTVVEELQNPRESFAGHELTTPWSRLQLAYFSGYAMWTYLTEPSHLTMPGVKTEELGTWDGDGETWRRLRVSYPSTIGTHSSEQILYVDAEGLLRRRDYEVEIAGGAPSVHYMSGHKEVAGVIIPTSRVVYVRDPEGHKVPEPVIVSIELDDIQFA
jgi:hypothetical protein